MARVVSQLGLLNGRGSASILGMCEQLANPCASQGDLRTHLGRSGRGILGDVKPAKLPSPSQNSTSRPPWASSLKPDFMTDLKEEEEEPGSSILARKCL